MGCDLWMSANKTSPRLLKSSEKMPEIEVHPLFGDMAERGPDRIASRRETALWVGAPGLGVAAKNMVHLVRGIRSTVTKNP